MEDIKITHPDKILFEKEKLTKQDIFDYYKNVSKFMMPYLENRILSVVRCPNGTSKECFFKKHPNTELAGVKAISLNNSKSEKKDYFYITKPIGILNQVQMGTIEFHTWGSNVKSLEYPDIMVFDLDPDVGMDLKQIRRGVMDLKEVLDELKLKSYLKTSGGKGYHVVVPIKNKMNWQKFHDFSKTVAEVLENKFPDKYTSNVRIKNRKNKIFIDWIRNGRGATSVAPYSLRSRELATVSMPIFFDELDKIAPNEITILKALKRLEKPDPWKDFFK